MRTLINATYLLFKRPPPTPLHMPHYDVIDYGCDHSTNLVSRSSDVSSDELELQPIARPSTPESSPLPLICPNAPRKKRRTYYCHDSSQTDITLGNREHGRAAVVSMSVMELRCRQCNLVWFRGRFCPACDQPLVVDRGINVGLYHMVPYFE